MGTQRSVSEDTIRLASGRELDLNRPRSNGPLNPEELAYCVENGVALAYDPLQVGWVTATCVDDLASGSQRSGDTPTPETFEREAEGLFEARVAPLAGAYRSEDQSWRAVEGRIWELAAEIVGELAAGADISVKTQLGTVRLLQAAANRLLNTAIVPAGERQDRVDRCGEYATRNELRPWRRSETRRFVELLDNPKIWEHLPEDYPDPLTEKIAAWLIKLSNEADYHEVRAVVRDGVAVGQIRLKFDSSTEVDEAVDAEISYWLGEAHWGQGIMTEVIPLYTLRSFQDRALESIFARVKDTNRASRAVLEKAGYRDEGRLVARLEGNEDVRTYRCFRADYLVDGPEPS